MWRRAVALALAGAFTLAACGGDSDEPAAPGGGGEPAAGGSEVVIEGFAFSPTPLEVAPGTTITVTNRDSATHTLTADDGSLDTGNLGQGESATVTVGQAGEIPYFCKIHDYMKGVIRVQG